MMPYDKYKRGHQHLNTGHQRITYKKRTIIIVTLTTKYKMKNKMNNNDNTKNNSNDDYNNKK